MTKYFKNACLAMALKIFKKSLPFHGIKYFQKIYLSCRAMACIDKQV
jgi:hypothetical protein